MRTFKSFIYLFIIAAGMLTSCNNDDNNGPCTYDSPVAFTSTINKSTVSRASGTQWGVDAIGVFMKKSGEQLAAGSIVDNAENKKFTTTGDGVFVQATPEDAIYFPQDGSKVDFVAYYPYDADLTGLVYAVNVSDQSKPEEIDLLYSANAVELSRQNAQAELKFDHMLTNLVFNITDETALGLTGLTVTFSGMNTQANFSLVDGTITANGTKQNFDALVTPNGNTATASAIILPTTTNEAAVIFQIGSRTYMWEIENGKVFAGKNRYTFDINLKSDGNVTILNPDGSITDWINNPGGTINLGGDDEGGTGTEANPFTIDQLAEKVGETAKWVEGYIVGSTTKTRVVGTPSTENILIAATADETDEANCIPVDIATSAVKANLDIVANPELIGKKIKVQGDIVNDIFSNTLSLTNITAQVGGATVPGGEPVEFFKETFGTAETLPSSAKVAAYTNPGYDMTAKGVTYTDPYEGKWADIRSTNGLLPTYNMHLWLPAYATNKECGFRIENFEAGYKDVTLSYDIAANLNSGQSINTDAISVKCNGTAVTVPSETLSTTNTFITIEISIPDGTTTIEFYSAEANDKGIRIDNITLTGTK